jgi:hypothetical protein
MNVFSSVLFPAREKRSPAESLFPFRQNCEIPTGAAWLKAGYDSIRRTDIRKVGCDGGCTLRTTKCLLQIHSEQKQQEYGWYRGL